MEKLVIRGGKPLCGRIRVSGSKNAALPIMAACLLTSGQCVIENVPRLRDIQFMGEVLTTLGAAVTWQDSTLVVDGAGVAPVHVEEQLLRKMRASNLVMGPLLGRFGHCRISQPGGCSIGSRPMDLHTKGMGVLGASINERYGYLEATATKLLGAEIHLDFPSVGATENLMMAAVLSEGTTYIRNAAREPEIIDLQNFLNAMGARVWGAGQDVIRIEGVKKLHGAHHRVIPDRIEGGTHLVAAAMTQGDILVENVIPRHMESLLFKLREAGLELSVRGETIRAVAKGRPRAVDIKTLPFPGFPTDMQPQMMAMMAMAQGTGVVTETVFENRFKHADELRRMGADIKIEGRVAVVKGVPSLGGALVEASDLRAGAALVLAGLAAEDPTVIEQIYHIDRGYEGLEKKYLGLGADIERISE